MIKILLEEKIKTLGVSYREAARQIGFSHTTLNRILDGGDYDLTTLIQICNWLNVNPATLLGTMTWNPDQLASQIAVFLQGSPEIARVVQKAVDRVITGGMSPDTLRDLAAYAAYKIQLVDGGTIETNLEEGIGPDGSNLVDARISDPSHSGGTS